MVYTGRESKLVMNSRAAPSKLSHIERTMNTLIYLVFAAQLAISAVSLVFFVLFKDLYLAELTYLCYNGSSSSNALLAAACDSSDDYNDAGYFVTFFILYNNFIPISLYVTVEVCNYFQAFFVDHDLRLYDAHSDTPALARTSNMNSDLGMVQYVFSDKTGTLTDNVMRFRRCSVAGVVYGDPPGDDPAADTAQAAASAQAKQHRSARTIAGAPIETIFGAVVDSAAIGGNSASLAVAADFVLCLACCHTVVVDSAAADASGELGLQSESPDEEALVKAAALLGFSFVGRAVGKVLLRKGGGFASSAAAISYELLATVPFDSTRKRMSVVVRRPDGTVVLFCKGADNVMLARASHFIDSSFASVALVESTVPRDTLVAHMDCFASDGLRTLVLAKRELSAEKYLEFSALWRQAETAVLDRDQCVAAAALSVEGELCVLGATAIEDKLQAEVPATIEHIHAAGIKLWVLTGDKMETAVNIGYSSRLLLPEMILIKLQYSGEDAATLRKKLAALLQHFQQLTEDQPGLYRTLMDIQSSIYSSIFGALQFGGFGNAANHSAVDASADSDLDSKDSQSGPHSRKSRWIAEMLEHPLPTSPAVDDEEEAPLMGDGRRKDSGRPKLSQLSSEHLSLIVDGDSLIKVGGCELFATSRNLHSILFRSWATPWRSACCYRWRCSARA